MNFCMLDLIVRFRKLVPDGCRPTQGTKIKVVLFEDLPAVFPSAKQ